MNAASFLSAVRAENPLVFSLTNVVTVNDCANILLAAGASPLMSDEPREAAEFAAMAKAVVINIGTPSASAVEAMLLAGKAANQAGVSVVLDPVGAGTTQWRTEILRRLLSEIRFSVIRGNASEIAFLSGDSFDGRGVDAGAAASDVSGTILRAEKVARRHHAVVGVSGPVDVICDGQAGFKVFNGHPMMPKVTGSGCMLSALTGAFCAAAKGDSLAAAATAFITMGCAGEIAAARLKEGEGNASFRKNLIDAVDLMTPEILQERGKYEAF